MKGTYSNTSQRNFFEPLLADFIDPKHELTLLSNQIDWHYFEKEFTPLYSKKGRKAVPIRMMVACLILKHLCNLGDETLPKSWITNPYMQYFCGESHFKHKFPFNPSDFVHFRKRIGKEGVEKIFKYSISLFGDDAKEESVLSDTSVQENNTKYPTAAGLANTIIEKCNKIAKKEGVKQRQTFKKLSKKLLRFSYGRNKPKQAKKAEEALKRLQGAARQLIDELFRKLTTEKLSLHEEELALFREVLTQDESKKGTEKLYSFAKPFTTCIAKGKVHKKYEYGNKIGLIVNAKNLVITSIKGFSGNPHDSKTIEPLLDQHERNLGILPKEVIYDRGGKGQKIIRGVRILTPGKPKKSDSKYERRKKRKKFRRRAAIEPVIGHLKEQFRMRKNYYHNEDSPTVNAMLAATAWNIKKYMEKLRREFLFCIEKLLIPALFRTKIRSQLSEINFFRRCLNF